MAAAEFVRFAALDAIEGGAQADEAGARLAPLIERTFRYSYKIATKMRDEMRTAGRGEEMEALLQAARGLQDELLDGAGAIAFLDRTTSQPRMPMACVGQLTHSTNRTGAWQRLGELAPLCGYDAT